MSLTMQRLAIGCVCAALGAAGCANGSVNPASPSVSPAVSGLAAAGAGPVDSQASASSRGTISEEVAFNGIICSLVFPGTPSQTSETLAIWNIGHAILDVPFDTSRPDLYAILPGTMHQVPGYPEFDHDHIASLGPSDPRYNGTWDLWVVTPGQNFNPVTYQAPRSAAAMFALIGSGVLSRPVGMAAAGFGRDIVIHAPLVCR